MNKCFYYDDRGICLNPVVSIDFNGMCERFWYKLQPSPRDEGRMNDKKEQIIIDADFETIEKEKEEAGDSQENL